LELDLEESQNQLALKEQELVLFLAMIINIVSNCVFFQNELIEENALKLKNAVDETRNAERENARELLTQVCCKNENNFFCVVVYSTHQRTSGKASLRNNCRQCKRRPSTMRA
jgi:hypothetical protein